MISNAALAFAHLMGVLYETAPNGNEAPANLADGPALLLYLGLIVIVSLLMLWNAVSYKQPALGHGEHGASHAHEALPVRSPERPAVVEAVTPADDLTVLEGIGPKTAAVFSAAGITTFSQLAETPVERLNEILDEASLYLGDPTTWPEQARLAARGDWEGLKRLTDELKGGRAS